MVSVQHARTVASARMLPALLLLFATAPISQAKLLTGSLDSRESWAFLDSFCFSRSGPGIITGTIHTREDGGQLLCRGHGKSVRSAGDGQGS